MSSVSHLRELKNKLWDVRVEWFRLGVELEIAVPDLDAIKVKHREDPNNCFTDMLSVWLKNSDAPTWTAILSALRTTGTNRRLADKIETELKEGSDTTQTDNGESIFIAFLYCVGVQLSMHVTIFTTMHTFRRNQQLTTRSRCSFHFLIKRDSTSPYMQLV